jgi:putative oxidoreductase
LNVRLRSSASWILRLGFAVILAWASADKILHPYDFGLDVLNYRVVNEGISFLVAIWLPYIELFTAVCLAVGLWLEAAAVINAVLMWAFLGLILQAFFRRLDIHCGCFTVRGESVIGPVKIGENALFAALSLLLVWAVCGGIKKRAG